MSSHCPLCGKIKAESVLFCPACTNKIKTGYEVDVPNITPDNTRKSTPVTSPTTLSDRKDDAVKPAIEPVIESNIDDASAHEKTNTKSRKPTAKKYLLIALYCAVILLPASGFYVYREFSLRDGVDRSDWAMASTTNTVDGYLKYMDKHPGGKFYVEAEANLRRLKGEEAEAWQRVSKSGNISDLRDFVDTHSDSPYTPLAKSRLDSLMWASAVSRNTKQGFSDYIAMVESGGFDGEHIIDARRRLDLLSSASSISPDDMMAVRLMIDGFFSAFSEGDYERLSGYLAPDVVRFFDIGASPRENVVSRLTAAQRRSAKFIPDTNALVCERNSNTIQCNVPFTKITTDANGQQQRMPGYIACFEMNSEYLITSVYEINP